MTTNPITVRVGLAMSGGGYRASAWGLGAMLALTDMRSPHAPRAEAVPVITMVSSVSGGSITNAEFGVGIDISSAEADVVDARAATYAPLLVGKTSFFLPVLAILASWHLLGGLFLDGVWPNDAERWFWVSIIAIAFGTLVGPACRDLVLGRWLTWLYVSVAVAGASGLVWILVQPWSFACRVGVAALAVVALSAYLWPRPYMIQSAYNARLKRHHGGHTPTLEDLGCPTAAGPLHVICITEVSGANFLYLGSSFAHNEDLGTAVMPTTAVAAAAQASSNLPGAFPVRWLSNRKLGLPSAKRIVPTTDGGAYDNMGSQWFTGLARRIARLAAQGGNAESVAKTLQVPDVVVVANASGLGKTKATWIALLPLVGWLAGVLRIKTILYEQTTAQRRRHLIDAFDADDPCGTLVHIQTPPDGYLAGEEQASPSERTAHARRAFATLTDPGWKSQTDQNARVATTLWPLRQIQMAAVIHHAYLQTAINMHLKIGTPIRVPPITEFRDLIAGTPRQLGQHWASPPDP